MTAPTTKVDGVVKRAAVYEIIAIYRTRALLRLVRAHARTGRAKLPLNEVVHLKRIHKIPEAVQRGWVRSDEPDEDARDWAQAMDVISDGEAGKQSESVQRMHRDHTGKKSSRNRKVLAPALFEVERIGGERVHKGVREFKTFWVGWKDPSWERTSAFVNPEARTMLSSWINSQNRTQ